jgi:molybdopterin molybdotransferase
MISPEEAWRRIENHVEALARVSSPRRRAQGRVLAEALEATIDVPGLDVSSMDGYALGSRPSADRPTPIAGIVAAGDAPGAKLEPGTALRIMTGAPLPEGADRVVPIEETNAVDDMLTVQTVPEAGDFVRRRGEVLRRGDVVLEAGALITPGALGLLATHGYAEVPVVASPSIAIMTTGDEVVAPESTPRAGQLRDSHTDFLLGALGSLGLDAVSLGISPDDVGALRERARVGLESDVFILTGGVSMGEFDLVEGVLADLGCEALFDAVAIQPGKPTVVARHTGGLVFALPGNPASAMVAFWLFVRPALRRLGGHRDAFWREAMTARLSGPLPAARGRDRFLPARIDWQAGELVARPVVPMGSHDVAGYALGTALVRIPARSPAREEGEACEVLPLIDWPAD